MRASLILLIVFSLGCSGTKQKTLTVKDVHASKGDLHGKTIRVRGHVGSGLMNAADDLCYLQISSDKEYLNCLFPYSERGNLIGLSGEVVIEGILNVDGDLIILRRAKIISSP